MQCKHHHRRAYRTTYQAEAYFERALWYLERCVGLRIRRLHQEDLWQGLDDLNETNQLWPEWEPQRQAT